LALFYRFIFLSMSVYMKNRTTNNIKVHGTIKQDGYGYVKIV